MTTSVPDAFAFQVLREASLAALPALYLLFLATLETPLVRALRTRGATWALAAAGLLGPLAVVAFPRAFVEGVQPVWFAPLEADSGGWSVAVRAVGALVMVVGLLVALAVYKASPVGTPTRTRAALFGVRDAGWAVVFGALVYWGLGGPVSLEAAAAVALLFSSVLFLYVPLLAYGILRAQLLDIDLKVKLAVEKSTIVATFAVAFLVASEAVERLLGIEGWTFGLAAAVLIGLLFRRVEQAAGRLADKVLPGVEDTAEYRTVRRRQVYRAAVESALEDGAVTDKERRVLATLAGELGLSAAEARDLERGAAGQAPKRAA